MLSWHDLAGDRPAAVAVVGVVRAGQRDGQFFGRGDSLQSGAERGRECIGQLRGVGCASGIRILDGDRTGGRPPHDRRGGRSRDNRFAVA